MASWRVVFGACVVLSLSSCTLAENVGPVALSVVDGEMALAFCKDQSIDSIRVLQLAPGADRVSGWQSIWEARGPVPVVFGEIIVVRDSMDQFLQSTIFDGFEGAAGFQYEVDVRLDDGTFYGPVLVSPASGLEEGKWVTTSKQTVEEPCEGISP